MMGILEYAFMLHAQQALQRKLDAMTEDDWTRLEEEQRINEEWADHNPSVFATCRRDPYEFIDHLVSVVAGPMGFYGNVAGVFLGPQRATIEEAKADAFHAAELALDCGFAGLQQAYWELFNFA